MAQIYFPQEYFPLEYFPKEYWPVMGAITYSTDPRRIFVVPAESRTCVIADDCEYVVPSENRTMLVEAEN